METEEGLLGKRKEIGEKWERDKRVMKGGVNMIRTHYICVKMS